METMVLTCEHLVFSCPMSLSISAGRSGQESPISGSTVKFNVRAILETINTPYHSPHLHLTACVIAFKDSTLLQT